MGIEPTRPAWKAGILPLNYTRIIKTQIAFCGFHNKIIISQSPKNVKPFLKIFFKLIILKAIPHKDCAADMKKKLFIVNSQLQYAHNNCLLHKIRKGVILC